MQEKCNHEDSKTRRKSWYSFESSRLRVAFECSVILKVAVRLFSSRASAARARRSHPRPPRARRSRRTRRPCAPRGSIPVRTAAAGPRPAGTGCRWCTETPRCRSRAPTVMRTGGTSRMCSIATRRSSGDERLSHRPRVADRAEHHLGFGRSATRRWAPRRRKSGRSCSACGRGPDRTAARSPRSSTSASISLSIADSPSSGNDECAARPLATSRSLRAPRVASASRLSVGSPSTRNREPVRRRVRRAGAVAAALLADDEQQADARFAGAPQPIDGRDLRRENALRVARSAPDDASALEAAREKRRDAVEVRRQDDARRCRGRRGR